MRYGFGVDLGGTSVKIACFTEQGTMVSKWEIPTDTSNAGENILPDITRSIKRYIEEKDLQDVLGIGIGVPGPVDDKGVIDRGINLGWGMFNIQKELEALAGYPVKAGNDATVAALGECWKGGGAGYNTMVMATLGTGVGGGIIIDGKPLHGVNGAGGEIGHMVLNREETDVCGCGKRGCVEQYCSATGVVRIAKQFLAKTDKSSSLRELQVLTCKDVFDAGAAGDELAGEILEQVYEYMGEFLANVCCVIDPEIIVLGGGVSRAGQPLLDGAQKSYKEKVFHATRGTKFAVATLGNDAGAYGAFKLVLDTFG